MDKIGFSRYIFVVTQEENRVRKARISRKMPYNENHLSSVWKELFVIDSVLTLPSSPGEQQVEPCVISYKVQSEGCGFPPNYSGFKSESASNPQIPMISLRNYQGHCMDKISPGKI